MRDEIGTCPNIKVVIDVMDKSPFFIRPYHVKEDKIILDRDEKIMLLRYIKRRFFSIFKSGHVDQKKGTQDKGVITDFRHLNVRID